MERKVSLITSTRALGGLFSSSGPLRMSHAAFICGKPEIFESPLMVKVSAPAFDAKLAGRLSVSEQSQNTSSAITAISPRRQITFSFVFSLDLLYSPDGFFCL